MRLLQLFLLAIFAVVSRTNSSFAQLPGISFDLTLGPSAASSSGYYVAEGAPAVIDLSLGVSFGSPSSWKNVVVVSAGSHGYLRTDGVRLLRPDGSCCIEYFPNFAVSSIVAGRQNPAKTLRLLGGVTRASESGSAALGVTLRADGALPIFRPIWGIASLRGVYIPDFNNNRFVLGGLSFGLSLR